jgi:FtsZ-interacting cell division protein YlmF
VSSSILISAGPADELGDADGEDAEDARPGDADARSDVPTDAGKSDGRLTREEFVRLQEAEKAEQKRQQELKRQELEKQKTQKASDQEAEMKSDARKRAIHWADNIIKDSNVKLSPQVCVCVLAPCRPRLHRKIRLTRLFEL